MYYLDKPGGRADSLADVNERKVADPTSYVLSFFPSPPVAATLNALLRPRGELSRGQKVYFAALARNRCVSIQLPPDLRGGLRFMSGVFGRDNY